VTTSPPSPPGRALQVGAELAGRSLALTLPRVLAFSAGALGEPGWPHRNLHTDPDRAREAGLDATIASGTQSEGLLIGLLLRAFGHDWHRSGTLDVRFVRPVRVDDVVQPMMRITARERITEGLRITAECWCQTAGGQRVIDGAAFCLVREVLDPVDPGDSEEPASSRVIPGDGEGPAAS
jgi:hypothetical protein